MTWQKRDRSSRFSRPPSLSTVHSNEEANFSNTRSTNAPHVSPYTGGASNRNSAVSPVEYFEHVSDPTLQPHHYLPTEGQMLDSKRAYVMTTEISEFEHKQDLEAAIPTDRAFPLPAPAFTRSVTAMSDVPSMTVSGEPGAHPIKYMKTRYMWMLLQLDQIPNWHNWVAAISAWIILAAYLVVPGTFTTFKNSESLGDTQGKNPSQLQNIENTITSSVDHVGLLALSGILAGVGSFNCLVLWLVHWKNYIWLCWKIFMPVMLNSFAGLLTTLVSVYTAQHGVWSITAKINGVVTGSVAFFGAIVYCMYTFWLLEGVKKDHRKHFPVDSELVDPIRKRKGLTRFEKIFPGE